ncbi:UNVERIFIED_ORG: metallophosphoesterase [Shinella sp. XGS7]|nr:metallophosphoesterase [Shinella sp. XGS7]
MRCEVLVVDDSFDGPEARGALYQEFFRECSKELSFEVVPTILERPNDLARLLRTRKFDAAIVDAVLNEREGWETFTSTEAIKQIGSNIPVAIISGQWDESNSAQISEALKQPNCRTFMHWRDLDPGRAGGQIDYAIRTFERMLFDSKNFDAALRLEEDSPLWILHVSDVQSGGFEDQNLKLETRRLTEIISEITKGAGPAFIAFTGDVAEHGDPAQYDAGLAWIKYFVEQLKWPSLPSRRVLYVPGNHDVNISLSASARLRYVPKPVGQEKASMELAEEVRQRSLIAYGLAPYRRFHDSVAVRDSFVDADSDWPTAWVEAGYRHLGVAFYGVNTASPLSPYGLPERKVDPNVLAAVSERLEEVRADVKDVSLVVIGLGHHNPLGASEDEGVKNPAAFATFFRGAVPTALFLHGHVHDHTVATGDTPAQMVRSCATTLTKGASARPSDSLRGFNLLKLKRSKGAVVGMTAYCINWIGSDLKETLRKSWVLDENAQFQIAQTEKD